MSKMNRLGNCKNPYQTAARKVLCVCSAGLLRSPTTANVLHQKYGFNTRAAGCVEEYALVAVDEVLLHWADEVVFMEQEHATRTMSNFPEWEGEFVVLDVPDMYEWNNKKLVDMIVERYEESLDGATTNSSGGEE